MRKDLDNQWGSVSQKERDRDRELEEGAGRELCPKQQKPPLGLRSKDPWWVWKGCGGHSRLHSVED